VNARWIDDPSNASRAHLRNRVRLDLLPALRSACPSLEGDLLALATGAADVRVRLESYAKAIAATDASGSVLRVPVSELSDLPANALANLWPAIAGLVGVTLDWRGTQRATAFTIRSRNGARVQLSGGWDLARSRGHFELSRASAPLNSADSRPLVQGLVWHDWRFTSTKGGARPSGAWVAQLPRGSELVVRRWLPGDRMRSNNGEPRRVKRFLSDAGVSGAARRRWPVVVADDEIVWIPGVRRSIAATVRPGRPGVFFRCEFDNR
jgi:tRNA(Ile)-lysidine synthase